MAYQNERVKGNVAKLVADWGETPLIECDVSSDDNVATAFERLGSEFDQLDIIVHSIAFANRDDLGGRFVDTEREGFRLALDISAYSLVSVARYGSPLMTDGGSILAMTFQASERVFPGYNVMGTAKAALENAVQQLAAEYGGRNIRVNAIAPEKTQSIQMWSEASVTDEQRRQIPHWVPPVEMNASCTAWSVSPVAMPSIVRMAR